MTKDRLKNELLLIPHYYYVHGTVGGLVLYMEVDIINSHLNWIVAEGSHETDFLDDLDAALDYYEKCGGFDK